MIKSLFLFLLFVPLTSNASLMFFPQEVREILEKRNQNHTNQRRKQEDYLECNGVLFHNKNNWSVWINGEKLTSNCPQCREGKINITRVNQSHISLEWHHKNVHHVVTLRPNEYYDSSLKSVITIQ